MVQGIFSSTLPSLNIIPIPYNTPNSLGVTFDRGMTFSKHTDNLNTKAKLRLYFLRALTNSSREEITQVYKQYIRLLPKGSSEDHSTNILTYAHRAWHPDLADTHLN